MATVTLLLRPGAQPEIFATAREALAGALVARQASTAAIALVTADDAQRARARGEALLATAEPGQLLLARATRDLVADDLPTGGALLDLGERALGEIARPEPVWAFADPASDVAGGAPIHLTSFIGRDAELREARGLLQAARLLTLTGAGGCGKSRLAAVLARDVAPAFPDGVWWVELAPVADPALLGAAVAEPLGVRALPGFTDLQAVAAHLAPRRALLVLDNCEHLAAAAAAVAAELLGAAPELRIVATSRVALGLEEERAWRIPSLPTPDTIRLFADRALSVRPGFVVGETTAPLVERICEDLDGIPLAVELAAARVRVLTVEQIATRLGDHLQLLSAGHDAALARQDTLRASIDWSHALLSADEQTLFRRLSVFSGGCSLDAVEAVCAGAGLDAYAVLNLLAALVDRSLVLVEERGAAARYRLAETVRQYAAERLAESGEERAVRDRHADAFLALAAEVEPLLRSPRQREGLDRLDPDAANFLAAIEHASATRPGVALELCSALYTWFGARRATSETRAAFGRALAAGVDEPPVQRARPTAHLATMLSAAGLFEEAREAAREALALAGDDDLSRALALELLGFVESAARPDAGRPDLLRGIEHARASGDRLTIALGLQFLAYGYLFQDDHPGALATTAELQGFFEELGSPEIAVGNALIDGSIAILRGRLDEARQIIDRAYATQEALPTVQAWLGAQVSLLDIVTGRSEQALAPLARTLEIAMRAGVGLSVPPILTWTAWAELATGRLAEARGRLEFTTAIVDGRDGLLTTWGYWLLGETLRLQGDAAGAADAARRAVAAGEEMRNPLGTARGRGVLARLAVAAGEPKDAEQHALAMLDALADGGYHLFLPSCLDALAEIAEALQAPEDAARLLGAAAEARRRTGIARWTPEDEHWAALEARLRDSVGDEPFAAGVALSTEEAIGWVRRARGFRGRPPSGWDALTPTELQVVELVSMGMTNPQVAERMFISRATVKAHLSHIFPKLDVRSRAELAAKAAARAK